MKEKTRINTPTCLNVASILILLLGLGSAVLIYQMAEGESGSVLSYDRDDDSSYLLSPGDSKKYLRDLELYGGKANVLATQLRYWFAGLWHGKPLAYIIALLSVLASYGTFRAGNRPLSDSETPIHRGDK
jgi:hypothetical protein